MNYTPFKRDYKTGTYSKKIRDSLEYKAIGSFHGPYASGKPEYMLSAPSQGISTAYLG